MLWVWKKNDQDGKRGPLGTPRKERAWTGEEVERDQNAVVSVTSVLSLQKKNLRLFLAILYLNPLQNDWGKKRCETQVRIQNLIKDESKLN